MTTTDANRAAIDSLVAPAPFVGAIAVSYLRVSTKEQAEKGGSAEGFSIPAQRATASLETIQNRIDAHYGEYAFARANLDDSLTLLSNAADIYKTADNANRRLCNQALFNAIYVDEDNDVRVGYKTPYDGLSVTDLQADALASAAEAKKTRQARTSIKGGPLVQSSNLTHLG